MTRKTFNQLVLLMGVCALPTAGMAGDDAASKRHPKYFKWFLEEIEVGKNRLHSGRGVAIYSPIDSPDIPPKHLPPSWYHNFLPYYSRMIPSSTRWTPDAIVPYYRGYCKSGKVSRQPCLVPEPPLVPDTSGAPSDNYGSFAGTTENESQILRLGGEGPYQRMIPDIIGGDAVTPPRAPPVMPPIAPEVIKAPGAQ